MTYSSRRPGNSPKSIPAGVAPDALRFFVRAGLLPGVSRNADVMPEYRELLRFVQRAQRLGFELREIRDLLAIDGVADETTPSLATVESQIETIEQRIIALVRVRDALLQTRERLERRRPHSPRPIMAALQADSSE